jgi:cell division septation protein DedD
MKTWRLAVVTAAIALVAACSNPEADWQKAEAENTEAAYHAFLDKHPEGEWAQKAQAQLDGIKDTRDWENAQTADAIEAYNNYLLAHPTGAHMGEARQRISELETEAAWQAAQATGSKEAIEDFLMRYADAPQAEQARARLAELNPAPPPPPEPKAAAPAAKATAKPATKPATKPAASAPAKSSGAAAAFPKGDFQVQVGAFSSAEKAQSEKARIEKRYKGIVGTLGVDKPTGGDKVYRVKSAGMTESAARSACQSLKRAGQDCMVVRR